MPTYQIECHECGTTRDQRLTFSDYDRVVKGERELLCDKCGLPAQIGFAPGSLGFILKEGESGGWASKSLKESDYRRKRRKVMAKREADHVFKPNLQPNYEGVETGTWKEAQELARKEKGRENKSLGDLSAATYEPLVRKGQVAT